MNMMGMGYHPMSNQTMPRKLVNNIAGASPVNVGKWERMGSALLGGLLVYRAIKNRRWSALLFGGTGLSLLTRGVSGVCPMYNKLGLSSAEG